MVNTNDLDISKAKGPVTSCRMCKNAGLPLALRTYCKFCLTSGYVHLCLPCNGSGRIGAPDAWGGGSIHRSTCNTCGGIGLIPAKEPPQPIVEEGAVTMPVGALDGAEVVEQIKEDTNDGSRKRQEGSPKSPQSEKLPAVPPAGVEGSTGDSRAAS